jgi:RecG-like helicase
MDTRYVYHVCTAVCARNRGQTFRIIWRDQLARALPGKVLGPLTGSVPAAARQVMVDQFSAAGHGAVLVSQIVAGGVGLNIQAASVVVICEPQLKPTTELNRRHASLVLRSRSTAPETVNHFAPSIPPSPLSH